MFFYVKPLTLFSVYRNVINRNRTVTVNKNITINSSILLFFFLPNIIEFIQYKPFINLELKKKLLLGQNDFFRNLPPRQKVQATPLYIYVVYCLYINLSVRSTS